MAKIVKKEYSDDREKVVNETVKFENQLHVLQGRIRELEDILQELKGVDTCYNHRGNDLIACVGRTHEQATELEDIIKLWAFKTNSRSEVFEKIENAPIKLRDKILMVYLFEVLYPTRGGGDDGDGPAAHLQMMMKRMFGG